MRRTLLISVAALALAAGGQVFAQTSGSGGGSTSGAGGGSGSTMQQSPSGGTGGSGMSGGASTSQPSGATTREQPSTGSAQTETAPGGQKGSKQQQGQTEHRNGSKQGATERREGGSKQGASEGTTKQGGSAGTTAGRSGGGSSHVTLNTEQKTKIRQSVLTSSAPRVSTVNFDVRVGTVVPRSVHIVELPPTLIEIEPQWRGYRYFVYHDEIVIVEPDTLRIVAVLEV
jgi:hypothetical protein